MIDIKQTDHSLTPPLQHDLLSSIENMKNDGYYYDEIKIILIGYLDSYYNDIWRSSAQATEMKVKRIKNLKEVNNDTT